MIICLILVREASWAVNIRTRGKEPGTERLPRFRNAFAAGQFPFLLEKAPSVAYFFVCLGVCVCSVVCRLDTGHGGDIS